MKQASMKKPILGSLLLIFLAISGFSQNEPDYKDEMIESGEHYEIPEENKSFEGDYA